MFKLISILSKTSLASVKATAGNDFLGTVSKIQEIPLKLRSDKRLSESNEAFLEAKNKLEQCISTNNFPFIVLKDIAFLFVKSIELNRNNQEAYVYISKIFYIIGNNKLSIKYLNLAKTIYNNSSTDELSKLLSNQEIYSNNIKDKIPANITTPSLQSGNFPSSKPVARTNIFNNILKK